jgi:hypothetical protein
VIVIVIALPQLNQTAPRCPAPRHQTWLDLGPGQAGVWRRPSSCSRRSDLTSEQLKAGAGAGAGVERQGLQEERDGPAANGIFAGIGVEEARCQERVMKEGKGHVKVPKFVA